MVGEEGPHSRAQIHGWVSSQPELHTAASKRTGKKKKGRKRKRKIRREETKIK